MTQSLLVQFDWRLGINSQLDFGKKIIERFPDYREMEEQYCIYSSDYEHKEKIKELVANALEKKPEHPARKAFLKLKAAERMVDIAYKEDLSQAEADYYYPNRFKHLNDAELEFEKAKKTMWVRNSDFKWILAEKSNINAKP